MKLNLSITFGPSFKRADKLLLINFGLRVKLLFRVDYVRCKSKSHEFTKVHGFAFVTDVIKGCLWINSLLLLAVKLKYFFELSLYQLDILLSILWRRRLELVTWATRYFLQRFLWLHSLLFYYLLFGMLNRWSVGLLLWLFWWLRFLLFGRLLLSILWISITFFLIIVDSKHIIVLNTVS